MPAAGMTVPELDVKALLQQHDAQIKELQATLAKELNEAAADSEKRGSCVKYDELWVLRFLLSHKANLAEAEAAARETLRWRKEKAALLEVGDDKANSPPPQTCQPYGHCILASGVVIASHAGGYGTVSSPEHSSPSMCMPTRFHT